MLLFADCSSTERFSGLGWWGAKINRKLWGDSPKANSVITPHPLTSLSLAHTWQLMHLVLSWVAKNFNNKKMHSTEERSTNVHKLLKVPETRPVYVESQSVE